MSESLVNQTFLDLPTLAGWVATFAGWVVALGWVATTLGLVSTGFATTAGLTSWADTFDAFLCLTSALLLLA